MTRAVVVIALGNPLRGDDGVGPAVAARLVEAALPDTDVVIVGGEATALIEAWQDRRLAILVDAVTTGAPPGTIHELLAGEDPLPDGRGRLETHSVGLAEGMALARALDRLPDELRVIGVEPADMTLGADLSPPVVAAIPELVERIRTRVTA